MSTLLAIILKEINLLRSQRTAILMLMLYPLLVIGALGFAFGSQIALQKVNIAIVIPQDIQLGAFSADDIFAIINGTNKVEIQRANSIEEAQQLIQQGKSDFGFVLRNQKTESGQAVADLLIDNSNMIAAGMLSPLAKAAIQLTSFEISSDLISGLWNKLLPAKDDLNSELGKIDLYLADLDNAETKIDSLDQKVSALDVSDAQTVLNRQGNNLDQTKLALQQFNNDYSSFKSDLADAKSSLSSTSTKLANYHEKVSTQIETTKRYRATIAGYLAKINEVSASLPESQTKKDLEELKQQMQETLNQIDSSIAELEQVKKDIEDSQASVALMQQKLDATDSRLDSEKVSVDKINANLGQGNQDISELNTQLNSLAQLSSEIKSLSSEAKSTKQDITVKLKNSKLMMTNFIGVLENLGAIKPSFLAHPIQTFEKNLYGEITPLSFIIPLSLGIVLLLTCLLFTSVSIITEKNEGTYLRMKLSSTHATELIIGKILGQMFFAFLVSIIILLLGVFVFGVTIKANILELFFAIGAISFCFISLGLLIANLTNTQSTAILISLILILPMIFLSGAILPLQLMNPTLKIISGFLPLTLANDLLSNLIVKGIPIVFLIPQLLLLLAPGIAITANAIRRF